jgi:hypothetical protein
VRGSQRHTEDRVRTELRLVVGAVEVSQHLVEPPLILRIVTDDRRCDPVVHVRYGLLHALAEVAVAPVPQFECLTGARRSAGRDEGPTASAGIQRDLDLDRRVPP